jgi:hypothetical protein
MPTFGPGVADRFEAASQVSKEAIAAAKIQQEQCALHCADATSATSDFCRSPACWIDRATTLWCVVPCMAVSLTAAEARLHCEVP